MDGSILWINGDKAVHLNKTGTHITIAFIEAMKEHDR